jgi:hypothetical protein
VYLKLAFTINVPSLMTVELLLFIQSQFTTDVLVCPAPELMHTWIGLIMDFRTFEGGQLTRKMFAGCESSSSQIKCFGKVPLHIKLELNTVGPLSAPSDINLKDGGGVKWKADLEKKYLPPY